MNTLRFQLRSWIALRALALSALFLAAAALSSWADPIPLESGWTVRLVSNELVGPTGVTYDPVSGDLFVTETGISSISRVTQTGTRSVICTYTDPHPTLLLHLAFDPVSRIVYHTGGIASGGLGLMKITEFGDPLEEIAFEHSGALAVAPDGRLYILTNGNAGLNQIARYNESDDTFTYVTGPVWAAGPPTGLSFDPSGDAYVSIGLPVVPWDSEFRVSGGNVSLIGRIPASASTFGDGSMLVMAGPSPPHEIWRLDPSGQAAPTVFAVGHESSFGMHFATNGRLYVTDYFMDSLWEYSPGSVAVEPATWSRIKSIFR